MRIKFYVFCRILERTFVAGAAEFNRMFYRPSQQPDCAKLMASNYGYFLIFAPGLDKRLTYSAGNVPASRGKGALYSMGEYWIGAGCPDSDKRAQEVHKKHLNGTL